MNSSQMDDRRRPHCRRNPREWLAVDGSKSLCGVEEEGEKKKEKDKEKKCHARHRWTRYAAEGGANRGDKMSR
jgi:hypothetical protein